MRETKDNRRFAVMSMGADEFEVHPDVYDALRFMLTDPTKTAKIEIGVATGNVTYVQFNAIAARMVLGETPAAKRPLYAFVK